MLDAVRLYFSELPRPELLRVVVAMRAGREIVSVRGKLPGALAAAGTFQWTNAVRALSVLLIRTVLARRFHLDGVSDTLEGHAGSLAASLDYAVSKEPTWLLEMFDCDANGHSRVRQLIKRSNAERKRPGPVIITMNEKSCPADRLFVVIGDKPATVEELRELLNRIDEREAQTIGAGVSGNGPGELIQAPPSTGAARYTHADAILGVVLQYGETNLEQITTILERRCGTWLNLDQIRGDALQLVKSGAASFSAGQLTPSPECRTKYETLREGMLRLLETEDGATATVSEELGVFRLRFDKARSMDACLPHVYAQCLALSRTSEPNYWHLDHATWPFMQPDQVERTVSKARTKSIYSTPNSLPADRWAADFYRRFGVMTRVGSPVPAVSDLWIIDDMLVLQSYPAEYRREMHKFFEICRNPERFSTTFFDDQFLSLPIRAEASVSIRPIDSRALRAALQR